MVFKNWKPIMYDPTSLDTKPDILKHDEKLLHFWTVNFILLFEVIIICLTKTKSLIINMIKLLLIVFMFMVEKYFKTIFL